MVKFKIELSNGSSQTKGALHSSYVHNLFVQFVNRRLTEPLKMAVN